MFISDELKDHLQQSSSVSSQSLVIAEWNLNFSENIQRVGNYRFRPTDDVATKFKIPASAFDLEDAPGYYTGATYSDVTINGGYDDTDLPISFISQKKKEELLFSLEDCFNRFRPRSGINKLRFFEGKFTNHSNEDMFSRPRYYMADKRDPFKYWTSYRTESSDGSTTERGIANNPTDGLFYIEDAAPFVVYKEPVPANRIVVKMQTNVGTVDLGPFSNSYEEFSDPLYGYANQTTPVKWKIQYLEDNNWVDAMSFNENSFKSDGSNIIGPDGYVEIAYGLKVPQKYKNNFHYINTLSSVSLLPDLASTGMAFMVKANDTDRGELYIWNGLSYDAPFPAEYGWQLLESEVISSIPYVKDFVNPPSFSNFLDGKSIFREFQYISGIRVVAETMNKLDATLDIIEISPRLTADISDMTKSFNLSKTASDIGVTGLPVGQLLAATGTLELFDVENAFSKTNTASIISGYSSRHAQFKFYEVIRNVSDYDYYIPLKTMYSEGFPNLSNASRTVSISLRDLFFYFESIIAPEMLITDVSLSYAISTALDYVGFSNYTFKRLENEADPIIPFFFIKPDISVAELLNDLARSTQSAMFFDEYNNLVVMSKGYLVPSADDRPTDISLYGSKDASVLGAFSNKNDSDILANIIEISSQEDIVYNSGIINYTNRYIERQENMSDALADNSLDYQKRWAYKPALLWKAGPEVSSVTGQTGSAYTMSALPLNSDLPATPPVVSNRVLVDNVIDVGESINYISRYSGYFYANGEIIKYDAVQYTIPGFTNTDGTSNFWISNYQDYQKYFSKVPFNGKIYATGLIRIYSEPNYETIDGVYMLKNGPVAKHGRAQFGTQITEHIAGLSSHWLDNSNIRGVTMSSKYIFGGEFSPTVSVGAAGKVIANPDNPVSSNVESYKTSRTSIIRNNLATVSPVQADINRAIATRPGTIQSSALVVTGRNFPAPEKAVDSVAYIYKPLTDKFKHFGTRMRIIGKIQNNGTQSPAGSSPYFSSSSEISSSSSSINGASGGIAILINPETNNGYFFEIAAITSDNIESYNTSNIKNVFFYKLGRDNSASNPTNAPAIPEMLWSSLSSNIITDSGDFAGQSRTLSEANPSVYDLSVEYQDIGSIRRFFLYINNTMVASVDDTSPLPIYNNMALFIRGSAKCMFEHVYAVGNNYSQNTGFALDSKVLDVFGTDALDMNKALNKYAISGAVQASYLSSINPSEPPKYNLFYDEFGTIMREAAYFDVKYDAYPALYSKISPSVSKIRQYIVSGFNARSYGAEFLVFNATDTILSMDSGSGNYLNIQGITFTQASDNRLTLDDYFSKNSNFYGQDFDPNDIVSYPSKVKEMYQDIKFSRMTYGQKEFTLDGTYIQSKDHAESLMSWLASKVLRSRASIGVRIFPNPMIQLGDIVTVNYKDDAGIDQVVSSDARFVVYNIAYDKSQDGPSMTLYLSEVF